MFLFLQQFKVQFMRNLTLFVSDKVNLLLAFVQAPLIAGLMVLTFYGNWNDCSKNDLMARTFDHYTAETAGLNTIGIDELTDCIERSYNKALSDDTSSQVFSEAMAQNRSVIYFILVAASIWIGILGSCKEIVSEWEVIHRESHSKISSFAYIASKSLLLCSIAGIQTGLLTYLSLPFLIPDSLSHAFDIWMILWLTAACAVETGLLVSCFSTSLQMALTCVPILMIPQLLLGGFLRPPARSPGNNIRDYAAALTIQRWSFEACIAVEARQKARKAGVTNDFKPKQKIVEIFLVRDEKKLTDSSYKSKLERAWRVIGCRYHALDNYFFPGPDEYKKAWEYHYQRALRILQYFLAALFGILAVSLKLRVLLNNIGGRSVFCIIRRCR